jgi:YVTN family beta-propeller protein
MKRIACLLSCLILLPLPLRATTVRIWVVDYTGNQVDVIDPATNKIVRSIKNIPRPSGVIVSPDGKRAYVTIETTEHLLDVIDTTTGEIVKQVVLSGRPNLPSVTPDGKTIAVCIRETGPPSPVGSGPLHDFHPDNQGRVAKFGGGVDIINANTFELVKTIPFDVPLHDCFASPDGKYVVAGSPEGKYAAVIDLQAKKVVWKVPFDSAVFTAAMKAGPDGKTKWLYLELEGLRGFAVVDFDQRKEVTEIHFPELSDPSMAPMRNSSSTHGTALSPDGRTLWIGNRGSSAVWAYSVPDLKLLGYVHLPMEHQGPEGRSKGGEQDWVTVTPDSKTVYVSNSAFDSVSAIDAKTMKEIARIPTGGEPKRIATEVMR